MIGLCLGLAIVISISAIVGGMICSYAYVLYITTKED